MPAHLTRIDVRQEPASCTCGDCGRALTLIRDEVVEKLDVIPAQFHVMRHIYPQMACRACETIVAAPSEASVIQGGLASARLLAWIIVSRFADHLPLYRLEQIAARQQVPLPRSTLSSWVGLVGYALGELVERLVKMLLQRAVLHADETPVQQLDPKAKLSVSVQRTHLPLKIKFAHDTVFTGAYHDPHTYPRHMATTPSRMAAKPTQQKRLLQKHNLKLITFYKWASKLSAKTTPTSLEQPPSAQVTPP
ncbi:MAG: transposase [Moraxellaceae bacterium]|nr:transposase [Moraxellaceae bacterium]